MPRVEAGIDVAQLAEACEQQCGADEEHQRERNLGHHEHAERALTCTGRAAPFLLQGDIDVGARRVQRRHQPEDHARDERDAHREQQRPHVDVNLVRTRNRRCRGAREHVSQPRCQQGARDAAGKREQQALDDQLPDNAPASGAQRQSNRDLALTRRSAGEQQVRDIRARDQEHAPDRGKQHQHWCPCVADDLVFERHQRHAGEVLRGVVGGERCSRQLGDGQLACDARRETRVDGERVSLVRRRELRCQRLGHDEVDATHEGELRRQHADNDGRLALDAHCAADRVWRAAEAILPETIADEQHVSTPRLLVFAGKGTAGDRRQAEQRKELCGYPQRRQSIGRAVDGHGEPRIAEDRGVLDDAAAARPRQVFLCGDDRPLESRLGPGFADDEQPIRIGEGERPQQHRIGRAEHRRGRANAEREDHERRRCEARAAQEHAGRESQVFQHEIVLFGSDGRHRIHAEHASCGEPFRD